MDFLNCGGNYNFSAFWSKFEVHDEMAIYTYRKNIIQLQKAKNRHDSLADTTVDYGLS